MMTTKLLIFNIIFFIGLTSYVVSHRKVKYEYPEQEILFEFIKKIEEHEMANNFHHKRK